MANKPAPLPNFKTPKTFPQFVIKERRGADESMIEFAKSTIIYAKTQFPNSDFDKCEFIKNQFKTRYGQTWSCCFLKVGGVSFDYFDCWIYFNYGEYNIHIWKSAR